MEVMQKKYVVTGGAGFIGSHLCDQLIDDGHSVICVDDLSTGTPLNIGQLARNDRFRLVVGDVGDSRLLDALIAEVDGVFHVAAVVGMKLAVRDPLRTLETNVLGAHNVIEQCNKHHKELLLVSTSEVYGHSTNCPTHETTGCLFNHLDFRRWSYAASKMIDEFFALSYHAQHQLHARVVRIFNTVGPRQSNEYGMVIPTFVQNAIDGLPLRVNGDGTQRRTFGHVFDVAWALSKLMASEAAIGQVVNVGGADEVTIEELAAMVIEQAQSSSLIEFVPFDKAYMPGFEEINRRVPDLERLTQLTGYRPMYNLVEVIDSVIAERRGLQSLANRREGN